MAKVARENCCHENVDDSVSVKCLTLKQKLDALLATMNEEAVTTCTSVTASTVRSSRNLDRIRVQNVILTFHANVICHCNATAHLYTYRLLNVFFHN